MFQLRSEPSSVIFIKIFQVVFNVEKYTLNLLFQHIWEDKLFFSRNA